MSRGVDLTVEEHLVRAARHEKVGVALHGAGDEWTAVLYFYAAHHLLRAALLADPIFTDPTRLSRKNPQLQLADRATKRHHGRAPKGQPRVWGINDLVVLMYQHVAVDYEALHQASIEVRYQSGLRSSLDDARAELDVIRSAQSSGRLVA